MSLGKHLGHSAHALHGVEKLPPLPEKANVLVAGLLGFFLGALGVAIYFRSWRDFLYFMCVFLPLAITGIGLPVAMCCTAAYGIRRAYSSNEKLEARSEEHTSELPSP